jgi:hypothetical protein
MKTLLLITTIILLFQTGCRSSIERMTGGSTINSSEMVGIEKKDLLKDRVTDARDDQRNAEKSFKVALASLKSFYADNSKDLEKKYRTLQFSYEDALKNATEVQQSIDSLKPLAQNLFNDWEQEIDKIDTVSLKTQSRQRLAESQSNYALLETQFKAIEEKMVPVLKKFNDQIHYLKYNLDAKSLSASKADNRLIQTEIERLITDLHKSVATADDFVKKMPTR